MKPRPLIYHHRCSSSRRLAYRGPRFRHHTRELERQDSIIRGLLSIARTLQEDPLGRHPRLGARAAVIHRRLSLYSAVSGFLTTRTARFAGRERCRLHPPNCGTSSAPTSSQPSPPQAPPPRQPPPQPHLHHLQVICPTPGQRYCLQRASLPANGSESAPTRSVLHPPGSGAAPSPAPAGPPSPRSMPARQLRAPPPPGLRVSSASPNFAFS